MKAVSGDAARYTLEDLKLNTFDRLSQVLPGQAAAWQCWGLNPTVLHGLTRVILEKGSEALDRLQPPKDQAGT